ncbi:hypothetical protein [Deefgea piscis]|uniref:hypothetical protein n=1 Tax=Deefgea piscis TaxID=2739061 RepID=UPI001C802412|nr:hypothetical protein [Deefgea piscis]QZA80847.1 hypothetical protein K4H25_15355 [Deefgea piscis]
MIRTFIFIIASLFAFNASAATQKKPSQFSPNIIKITPETTTLSSVDRKGNDPACIHAAGDVLSVLQIPVKGQYEKTSDFELRLQKDNEELSKMKLCGNLSLSDTFAIKIPAIKTYNADTEKLTVSIKFDTARDTGCGVFVGAGHVEKKGKSYMGQNGFGVKKLISTYTVKERIIADDYSYKRTCPISDVQLSRTPSEAKKGQRIAALYFGKLIKPYSTSIDYEDTPTMDNPQHVFWTTTHTKVEWVDYVYFDETTGEVLTQ